MNYQSAMDGPDGRTTPDSDASTPQWPVLARLPYVGDETQQEPPAAWGRNDRVDAAHLAGPEPGAPPLRFADPASDYRSISYDRVDYAESPANRRAAPARYATAPPPEEYAQTNQRRYRFDAAVPRGAAPPAGGRSLSPQGEPQTIAARVFQWHAMLAPYAGLAMTFVLAMFAGLLYWSLSGQPSVPASDVTSAPQWAADVDPQQEEELRFWSLQSSTPNSLAPPLSQTPTIQLNIPPLGAMNGESAETAELAATPTGEAEESEPAIGAVSEEAKPIEEVGAPAAEKAAEQPHLAADSEAIAPTAGAPPTPAPTPLTMSYPTTPFASFDFGPTAHQAAAPTDSPAPAAPR